MGRRTKTRWESRVRARQPGWSLAIPVTPTAAKGRTFHHPKEANDEIE
ncbi:MAG: hypothetical protein ACM3MK_02090 [Chitinophagales bacterium]